jgi:hypothetical protein
MNYTQSLEATIHKITEEKATADAELKKLEEEFANVKLNPYGITSIDFAKRQELSTDAIKMEGVIMGLTLALETFKGSSESVTAGE